MEYTKRRGGARLITKIFSVAFSLGFILSSIATINAFAAANIFQIQNAELTTISATAEGNIESFDEENVVSNVTFHRLGDTAEYTITLQNTDTKDHIIESITNDNENEFVIYEHDSYANTTVAAGADFEFVVTAKYANSVTDMATRVQTTNVKFTINYKDIEPETISINPNTVDNIWNSVTALIISAAGLIVCAVIYAKNHKKFAKVLGAVIALVATATIFAGAKAATVEVSSFTIAANYGLNDKVVVLIGDEETVIDYGETIGNTIPNPDKPGYIFNGWTDENDEDIDPTDPIYEDVTIKPKYTAISYKVHFDANGADGEMSDQTFTYDEAQNLTNNAFTYIGRTFEGWDTEAAGTGIHYDNQQSITNLTTTNNDIINLFAQWSINPYYISYDANGAEGEMAQTNCEYDQDCTLRTNAFTKTGYNFAGWKLDEQDFTDGQTVRNLAQQGTVILVAQWAPRHYTIEFDGNNATDGSMNSIQATYDQDVNLPASAFTRTGYTQNGWLNGSETITNQATVKNLTAEDDVTVTLEANWEANHYTISFNKNHEDAQGSINPINVVYDTDITLPSEGFTCDHYKFMGWATNADGEVVYTGGASVRNLTDEPNGEITFYAVWKERTSTLETGSNVNASLKTINSAATSFAHYAGTPNLDEIEDEVDIALATSNFPVWAWADGNTIYWWSEAEVPNYNANSSNMFNKMTTLESIDLKGLNSSTATNMANFFNECKALQSIDLADFDSSNVKNMSNMFRYTESLPSIDFTKINTSSATDMSGMFSYNGTPTLNISGLDTSNVKTMRSMFEKAKASTIIVGDIDTHKVTDMQAMFQDTQNITSLDLRGLDTENVTTMGSMFCAFWTTSKLANLDISTFDTGKVQNFSLMFYGDIALTNLDLRHFNTSSATTMYYMFNAVRSAATINVSGWTNDNVTDMSYMFYGAGNSNSKIIMDNFATPKVTNMTSMFGDMRSIPELDVSSFNTSTVTKMTNMFNSSYASTPMALQTIYASDNFTTSAIGDTQTVYTNTRAIVGGAGTTWNNSAENYNMSTYSRIDDPDNGKPGYFTIKGARYIRYNGNGADNATPYGTMTSEYLKAGDSLKKNAFARDGYVFNGWKDADNNEYADEQVMADLTESKTPLELYAQWKEKSSTLQSGTNVNQIMRNLNTDATSFRKYPGTPTATTLENAQRISTSESNYPAYMWNDGDTLYWWSEAEKVYLSNGSSFFHNMQKLKTIDVVGLDTSKVKIMRQMFMNCYALTSLDLSTFNTSAVTDMANMFSNDTALTSLNVTSFDTSKVGQMNGIFQGFAGEVLDLSSFDTSSVGGNVIAFFSSTSNLKTVYVGDKWTATNVDIPSTTPLVGGAGSTSGGARLDNPDNNSRGRLSKKDARYIRYNGNGADNATPYGTMTSEYLKAGDSLKKNAFTRSGYVFTGWKDADNNEYTDEQVMTDLTESKTPLELYAQWDAAPYTVIFNANGGEVLQGAKTVAYLQSYGELPTPVRYDYANGMLGGKYGFKEWNTKADGSGDTITPSSLYENTDDTTLYAIWNDHFTVTIYNGESETPTIASYEISDIIYLNAQNVTGKQFLYWEVDGAKKSYGEQYSMRMFQGKDLTIRAVYGSESDLESQQPGAYISDIYRQYSGNKIVARSYSYIPDGYEIVEAGVIATLDANIANGTFDDQTATYVRTNSYDSDTFYFTWTKSNVTSEQTVYVKAYLKYKDADGVEHTIYGDLVTATLTE